MTTKLSEKSAVRKVQENNKHFATNAENHYEGQAELDNDFVGVERKGTGRIYLSGVNEGVDVEKIKEYINRRGVNPLVIRLLPSERKGTVAVKINVLATDFETVLKNKFWPTNVYVRPWLSVNKWSEKRKMNSEEKE